MLTTVAQVQLVQTEGPSWLLITLVQRVAWPSGKAEDCKSFTPSSILGAAFRTAAHEIVLNSVASSSLSFSKFFGRLYFEARAEFASLK